MDQEQRFEMPASMLQGIANYLASRPYREVHGLMAAIGTLEPVRAAEAPAPGKRPAKP